MEMESGKVFVGGISWDTNEDSLREYFQTFGVVMEAVIMKDRATGRARGFGFVVFADASIAEKVVKERHIIDGRIVEAKKVIPRDDHHNFNRSSGSISVHSSPGPIRTRKIFVGGLASTVTETDFKRYFEQFGTITDVVVMYDHNTQRPRGFGFVTYDSEEAVDRVLFKTFHELNAKMVEVKRAVPKELSPGPARSLSSSYGLNRMSSFSSPYNQGHNGRFSPASVGRSGYSPYSPFNYSKATTLDTLFGLTYGATRDSSFEYGRGNMNQYGSPIGYNGNGTLSNTTSQSLWGGGSLDYGSKGFGGSRAANTGLVGNLQSIEEIWGLTDSLNAQNTGYGNRENSFGYSTAISNTRDENLGNLLGDKSFYSDHAWGSTSFGYEHSASSNVAPNNEVGYVGGYNVNARSNRGIAA